MHQPGGCAIGRAHSRMRFGESRCRPEAGKRPSLPASGCAPRQTNASPSMRRRCDGSCLRRLRSVIRNDNPIAVVIARDRTRRAAHKQSSAGRGLRAM